MFKIQRLTAILAALLLLPGVLPACPFCSAPSLTLSEQVEQSDAVVLAKWVSATKPERRFRLEGDELKAENIDKPKPKPAATQFQVIEVVRHPGDLEKSDEVTLPRYIAGKPGELFLLLGTKGKTIDWGSPLEVSPAAFSYIKKSPDSKQAPMKRLEFFLQYLEFPDEMVANDAYAEFANAPYEDIKKVQESMPRERLHKWVSSDDTSVTRLGLYGLLLGLSGNETDAELMKKKIIAPTKDFRLGIDGVMSGYLLLTKEKGLKIIEETKLVKNAKVPFSETYSAMQALRFMWTYGDGAIGKDRLRQSMRILLDRPELADLVIADLARWKDWSVQDRLMKLYDEKGYTIPSIRRAIVRYMLACTKDAGEDGKKPPERVVKAKANLDTLRDNDPVTVRQAERFFFIN